MLIVIIDSGIDKDYSSEYSIDGISINNSNVINNYDDEVGHGTAVVDTLIKYCGASINIFMIKILGSQYNSSAEDLCVALEYIYEHIYCDFVLISMGVNIISDYQRLVKLIGKLYDKGIVIVSAFDNGGAISYPAALKNVIGVDTSQDLSKINEWCYVENSIVNVITSQTNFRFKWLHGVNSIGNGSSFSAAYVTALLASYFEQHNISEDKFGKALEYLKKSSTHIINNKKYNPIIKRFSNLDKVERAVAFPFNKEIHSLALFEDMLPFTVDGFYDIRQTGKTNLKIRELLPFSDNEKIIKNIDSLNWDSDFDLFILGHITEMSNLIGKNIVIDIINNCKIHNKQIYMFDDLRKIMNKKSDKNIFYPYIDKRAVYRNNLGKFHVCGKPILGVFGTSSMQCKFTLQLNLRRMFIENGYKVAQIGTEPSSYLFGFDYLYPMGYHSTVYTQSIDSVMILNQMMHECEKKDPDIIIVGCQSSTIPYSYDNVKYLTLPQFEFILGTTPDVVILCVNPFDDVEYIKRTIAFLESIVECEVIGVVISPPKNKWDRDVSNFERNELSAVLKKTILDFSDIDNIYKLIIDSLT